MVQDIITEITVERYCANYLVKETGIHEIHASNLMHHIFETFREEIPGFNAELQLEVLELKKKIEDYKIMSAIIKHNINQTNEE